MCRDMCTHTCMPQLGYSVDGLRVDSSAGMSIATLHGGCAVVAVGFSCSGELVSAEADGTVSLWRAAGPSPWCIGHALLVKLHGLVWRTQIEHTPGDRQTSGMAGDGDTHALGMSVHTSHR